MTNKDKEFLIELRNLLEKYNIEISASVYDGEFADMNFSNGSSQTYHTGEMVLNTVVIDRILKESEK